jgi:hypothetical protein
MNASHLVQMDAMRTGVEYVLYPIKGQRHYQYTALDDCTRWRFAKIYCELSVNKPNPSFLPEADPSLAEKSF